MILKILKKIAPQLLRHVFLMFNLLLRLYDELRGPYIGVRTDYLADKMTEFYILGLDGAGEKGSTWDCCKHFSITDS